MKYIKHAFYLHVRNILITFFFLLTLFPGKGETPEGSPVPNEETKGCGSYLRFDVRPSYLFSSYKDDVLSRDLDTSDGVVTHYATSLDLQYGFSFSPDSKTGQTYPGVRQGLGIEASLFRYPSRIGTPVTVYIWQGAPVVRFSRRLSLDYEWNFGLSAGWKPSDGRIALSNVITGSTVNAYINLGVGLTYRLTTSYSFYAGLDITHYSNGNTAFPNPGVNSAGLRLGIEKTFGPEASGTPFDVAGTGRHISCDVVAYGAWRRRVYRGGEEPVLLKGHYPVAGLGISPMWDMKKWLRVGVSADFQWDSSSDLKHYHISGNETEDIRFGHPPFFSQLCGGLALRGELVMPLFSVNVGIGYNLFGPEESRASYQMANLRIRLPRSFFINIGYQLLDFQRQNNLMLGVGYTISSSTS